MGEGEAFPLVPADVQVPVDADVLGEGLLHGLDQRLWAFILVEEIHGWWQAFRGKAQRLAHVFVAGICCQDNLRQRSILFFLSQQQTTDVLLIVLIQHTDVEDCQMDAFLPQLLLCIFHS